MSASAGLRLAAAAAVALLAAVAAPFLVATASDPGAAAIAVAIELALAACAGGLAARGSMTRALVVALGVLALCGLAAWLFWAGLDSESNWI